MRIALATVFALTALGAVSAQAAPTPDQGLADLNAWRAEAGEAQVASFNPEWNEGCRLHNEYENLNGGLTHEEQPGNPGYTTAGDDAGRHSVLAGGEKLPREAWSGLVYHREQVLAPRLRVSGYFASSGFTCLRTIGGEFDNSPSGRTDQLTAYPWPPNGATNVPLTFSGGETPSPYDVAQGVERLGYLLSVDFNGPWEKEPVFAQSQVSSASLTPDGGAAVPLVIDDVNTGYSAGFGMPFGLFPTQPLARCTWYTATATGTAYPSGIKTSYPINLSWRFQTTCSEDYESLYGTPGVSFAKVKVRGHRLKVRLRLTPPEYPFDGVSLVARHGKKRRALKLRGNLVSSARLASGKWNLLARAAEIRRGERVWFLTNTRRIRIP
ncbi:MAG TPA: hypothetical protein VG518_00785 [Solirubrobacterales bacterium]|nr:hypothetical protein [Solirubrobacterales bacterium]